MRTADPGEALLVLRAQSGDAEAFAALYESAAPALRGYVRWAAGGRADVEDVLHDVFLIVYRKVRWLRDPASFRPWIYRIAARQVLTACRARDTQLTDEEWQQMRAHRASTPDRDILLEAARQRIADLPAASRAVLSLHYLEGLTLEEAAAVLGIPVGTAKSRLSAGIARLRVWLGAGG